MYNFKFIIQIQKQEWEDTITKGKNEKILLRRVSIEVPKVRINLAIKRLRNYIGFTFCFLSKSHHFLLLFSLTLLILNVFLKIYKILLNFINL